MFAEEMVFELRGAWAAAVWERTAGPRSGRPAWYEEEEVASVLADGILEVANSLNRRWQLWKKKFKKNGAAPDEMVAVARAAHAAARQTLMAVDMILATSR